MRRHSSGWKRAGLLVCVWKMRRNRLSVWTWDRVSEGRHRVELMASLPSPRGSDRWARTLTMNSMSFYYILYIIYFWSQLSHSENEAWVISSTTLVTILPEVPTLSFLSKWDFTVFRIGTLCVLGRFRVSRWCGIVGMEQSSRHSPTSVSS